MSERMHDCQKFREELTDRILGGAGSDDELRRELSSCEGCASFYNDAQSVLRIVDSARIRPPELPAAYWEEFSDRLRSNLAEIPHSPRQSEPRNPKQGMTWLFLAAA